MTHSDDEVSNRLAVLTEPDVRGRLFARGQARNQIWEEGSLPAGAPDFADDLTADLLDHSFAIISEALWYIEHFDRNEEVSQAFRTAAEAIESAVRDGDPEREDRGFYLVIAAAAYHLAGYAARSYCLLPEDGHDLESSPFGRTLAFLMRRSLESLRPYCVSWLRSPRNADANVARRLTEDDNFLVQDAVLVALTTTFIRGIAQLDFSLRTGQQDAVEAALQRLEDVQTAASDIDAVSVYWYSRLARQVVLEVWRNSLHVRLPLLEPDDPDRDDWLRLRRQFITVLSSRDISEVDLWPSQLEAAERAADPSDDLVVALPTSAGKTRIAELCILRALASGQRVVYVTPLRALSAQLERTLSQSFRPLGFRVSSLYGASGVTAADVDVLQEYDIVVATPEKLDFSIRQAPALLNDVGLVVLDEGHMIGGAGRREIRYEVLIQRLLQRDDADERRLVCLSAVFATDDNFSDFIDWIRNDQPGTPLESTWRPTRQRYGELVWDFDRDIARLNFQTDDVDAFIPRFITSEEPLSRRRNPFPQDKQEMTIATTLRLLEDGHQVLIYCPQKRSVESLAETFNTLEQQGYFNTLRSPDTNISRALRLGGEWLGDEHIALSALKLGVGLHHGSLPRPFLSEVESLVDSGQLPVTIASPTVAQGLDLPCSALVLHSLYRAGEPIPAPEFTNVVGRVGRAFVDLDGITIAPIFEEDDWSRRRKRQVFQALRQRAQRQSMESGVLVLLNNIATILADRLNGDIDALMEYVFNYTEPWESIGTEEAEQAEDLDRLSRLIEDLDTVILTAVEDKSHPVEDIAEALDEALRSSLWRRQLESKPDQVEDIQSRLLHQRARWLWHNSSDIERVGYFVSGLGYRPGNRLREELDSLMEWLTQSDSSLNRQDTDSAVDAIGNIADTVFSISAFEPSDLPDQWRQILSGWVRGQPVRELTGADPSGTVNFVQEGIVYRLVWAVDSIRVTADVHGHYLIDDLTGATPRTLTFGLPTAQTALLAQAGLPSRRMAIHLLHHYPAHFVNFGGLREWLQRIEPEIGPGFWTDRQSHEVWQNFLEEWRQHGEQGEWESREFQRSVTWTADTPPPPGEEVQLVTLGTPERTEVVASDLQVLGQLDAPVSPVGRPGQVRASVAPDRESIIIKQFGPPR